MKKLILGIKGYQKIDITRAEWEHVCNSATGEEVFTVDYSIYEVYYNKKRNKYKMLISGFRPMEHFMYVELKSIITFLNLSDKLGNLPFTKTDQDYFLQKVKLNEELKEESQGDKGFGPQFKKAKILRLQLDVYKERLPLIKKDDVFLVGIMQKYKLEHLSKNEEIEIYEDLGNVIVTSEGCYFTAYDADLNFEIDSEDEEDEEQ